MNDEFGMPIVDNRPAHEVIAELRQQLADSQKQVTLLRDALDAVLNMITRAQPSVDTIHGARKALAATTDLKDVILCHAEPVGFRAFNEPQSCWEYGREPEDTQGTYSLEPEPLYRAWEPK